MKCHEKPNVEKFWKWSPGNRPDAHPYRSDLNHLYDQHVMSEVVKKPTGPITASEIEAALTNPMEAAMLAVGITDTLLAFRIREGLDGQRQEARYAPSTEGRRTWKYSKKMPDLKTRLHYVELALKLRGAFPAVKHALEGRDSGPVALSTRSAVSMIDRDGIRQTIDQVLNQGGDSGGEDS